MASIVSLISLIFTVLQQIPGLIKMIQEMQRNAHAADQVKAEKERSDAANQNGLDLKNAEENEDEAAQKAALSKSVSDWNK